MPPLAGIGIGLGTALAGGAAAGATVYGASRQSRAAQSAAQLQAQAAREAAAAQERSNAAQLSYLQRESGLDRATAQAMQRGNYNQWAASRRNLNTVGGWLGFPAQEIPGYVPLPEGGSATGEASGAVPSRPGDLAAALKNANDLAYGYAKHQDPNYWQALWAKDPDYAWKRMLGWQAGASDAARQGPYAPRAGSVGSYF